MSSAKQSFGQNKSRQFHHIDHTHTMPVKFQVICARPDTIVFYLYVQILGEDYNAISAPRNLLHPLLMPPLVSTDIVNPLPYLNQWIR